MELNIKLKTIFSYSLKNPVFIFLKHILNLRGSPRKNLILMNVRTYLRMKILTAVLDLRLF